MCHYHANKEKKRTSSQGLTKNIVWSTQGDNGCIKGIHLCIKRSEGEALTAAILPFSDLCNYFFHFDWSTCLLQQKKDDEFLRLNLLSTSAGLVVKPHKVSIKRETTGLSSCHKGHDRLRSRNHQQHLFLHRGQVTDLQCSLMLMNSGLPMRLRKKKRIKSSLRVLW